MLANSVDKVNYQQLMLESWREGSLAEATIARSLQAVMCRRHPDTTFEAALELLRLQRRS